MPDIDYEHLERDLEDATRISVMGHKRGGVHVGSRLFLKRQVKVDRDNARLVLKAPNAKNATYRSLVKEVGKISIEFEGLREGVFWEWEGERFVRRNRPPMG